MFATATNQSHLEIIKDLYRKGDYKFANEYLQRHKKFFTQEKYNEINHALVKAYVDKLLVKH